ncbi:DUF6538 domain-containing protein [Halomonas saccharevitans]|uniref:DUF6538 domain-containing protein n=1 Tax=Halomonas saccharevitans TaxID=416872 RepID=UPI003CCBC722
MPSNPPYLIRSRHGIYYFRLVIPPSQRSSIGKTEFRRSLRTRSKREAVMRCAEALTEAMGILAGQGSEKAPVTPLQAPKPVISRFCLESQHVGNDLCRPGIPSL